MGNTHYQQCSKALAAERRTMVHWQEKIRRTEEDQRKARQTDLEGLDEVGSSERMTGLKSRSC